MRTTAILIAIAALVDPVWSVSRQPPRELAVIDLTTNGAPALGMEVEGWRVTARSGGDHRLPCGPDERCVVVADGSRDIDVPGDRRVALSMITVRGDTAPNIALRAVTAAAAHSMAAGSLRAELLRTGAVESTEVRVMDGAAVVGSAVHQWRSETSSMLEVPWWPIQSGVRRLRVEVVQAEGETTTIDNAIDLGVEVGDGRVPVLVFDARPSWGSTFVRRLLEDDSRFAVSYRARLAPSLSAGTSNGVLDAGTLEALPVVIVGAPDALTAVDVALLDRFVNERGGTLVLLPEHRVSGPASRFFPGAWTEHLVPVAERIGPLLATEILRSTDVPLSASVLGHSGNATSIVALPSGAGRIVIAGALDAWRHRDADFDRFWRSTVAQGAAAGAALRIAIGSQIAASGDRMPFTLRHHSLEPRSAIEATVSATCGDSAAAPVRVWPSGPIGELTGVVVAEGQSQCQIDAAAGDRTASAAIAVTNRVTRGVDVTLSKLERAVTRSGGMVASDEAALTRALNAAPSPTSQIVSIHPLRSAWWIIPFAACLSAEWWLRRRAGLR